MRYANFDTNKLHALNKFMNNIKAGDKKTDAGGYPIAVPRIVYRL